CACNRHVTIGHKDRPKEQRCFTEGFMADSVNRIVPAPVTIDRAGQSSRDGRRKKPPGPGKRMERRRRDAYLERLEEVARSAEETRQSCLAALANLHKSMQALQARAQAPAQDCAAAPPAGAQRKEHYEAAALLLSAGQKSERIAHLLG